MKLVRYGKSGKERPGLVDGAGKIRDLSDIIADVGGDALSPKVLARLAKVKPEALPLVRGKPRLGPCVADVGSSRRIGRLSSPS
jgi:2,4-didehydro-3-deoxy-L-rhamnonate hydrolase